MVSSLPPPPSRFATIKPCAVYVSRGESGHSARGSLTLERSLESAPEPAVKSDGVSIAAPGLQPLVIRPSEYDVVVVGGMAGTLKIGVFPTRAEPTVTGSSAALYLYTGGQTVGHRVIRWTIATLLLLLLLVILGLLMSSTGGSYLGAGAAIALVSMLFLLVRPYMWFMSKVSNASPPDDVLATLAAAGFYDVTDRELLAKHVPQKLKNEKTVGRIAYMTVVAFFYPIECLVASLVVVIPASLIAPEQWGVPVRIMSMIIGVPLCGVVLYRPTLRFLMEQSRRRYERRMQSLINGIPGLHDPLILRPSDVWAGEPTPKSWWIVAGGIVLTWWIGIAVARLVFA